MNLTTNSLQETIDRARSIAISPARKKILQPLVEYLQMKRETTSHLHFICTHNSRRSQLSQLWAKVASYYYGLDVNCYSGGVEVTNFNHRVITTILNQGFDIVEIQEGENPIYKVKILPNEPSLKMFSKLFNDEVNPNHNFAAILTCDNADENCPYIPGAERRIPILYEDPKKYDNTPLQEEKYAEKSLEIASEMFWIFSQIDQ